MLISDHISAQEEFVRNRINHLPDNKRKDFYSKVKKKIKDPDT